MVVDKLFLLLAVFLLSACMQGETNVESGNREQVLHFGNGGEIQGLDPHVVTGGSEQHVVQALFEGLVVKDARTLCLLYTSPSPRDKRQSRMPSSA